jgi:S1-C subfamily serine protease
MRIHRRITRGGASLVVAVLLFLAVCLVIPKPWWSKEAGPPPSLFSFPRSWGTGFLVARNGWLLTNAHVTSGCTRVTVGNGELSGLVADKVLYPTDRQIDLAAVHVPLHSPMFLRFADMSWPLPTSNLEPSAAKVLKDFEALGAANGYSASVVGFPGYDHTSSPVRLDAELSAATSSDRRHWFLTVKAPIRPGSSGSAVLDARGEVVGVIFSGTMDVPKHLPAAVLKAAIEALPHSATQGLAVPAATAAALLRAADPLADDHGPSAASDPANSVVRVFCWK